MFNNFNSTLLKKVLVIFLIITLTYANLVLIGTNIVQGLFSYAVEENEEQNLVVANQELVMNKVYGEGEEAKRVIQVAIETGIEAEEYPIKEATIILGTDLIEAELLDLKVTELNRNSYTSGTWEVSQEGKLIISLVNENETLEAKEKGLDKILVTYVFENSEIETIKKPLENVELTRYDEVISTKANEVANFEYINVQKELSLLNIVNKDIHKTTIESGKVDYTETLKLDLSYRNAAENITIEDISNDFYNADEQKNTEVVLQYKTTKMNKNDLINLLGDESKLIIKDLTTDKVVAEIAKEILETEGVTEQKFTVGEPEEQTEDIRSKVTVTEEIVEIEYLAQVTSFKLELLNIKTQSESQIDISDFVIENTKSISNVNDLENLGSLQENVKYIVNEEKTVQSIIKFKDTTTRANLTVDNTEWVVGEANKVKYTITLDTITEKSELFVNPMFLIEMPSCVESINTAKSQFTINNDKGVFTGKKVFTTTVLNKKYVVIALTGAQTEEFIKNENTTINLSLEINIKEEAEGNKTTKLYYQNDTVTTYESGVSFDTDEVEISLILASEEKEEILEKVLPNVSIYMSSSADDVVKPGETIEYKIDLYNYEQKEFENLAITSILPNGLTLENVQEIVDDEEKNIQYDYNEETRKISIPVDKLEATKNEIVTKEETDEEDFYTKIGYKEFIITAKVEPLEEGVYSKEIKTFATVEIEEDKFETEEMANVISDVFIVVEPQKLQEQINENENIIFEVKITNKGLVNAYPLTYTVKIPENIKLRMVKYGIEGEPETEATIGSNEYKQTLIELPAEKTYFIRLTGTVQEIDETKTITVTGTFDGEEFSWNTEIVDVPENPDNPENPNEPTDPENPDNPINPDEPEEPENPDNPINPDEPEHPENPDNPINPDEPEDPENPDNPTNPDEPEDPENPDNPTNPDEPTNPEEPIEGFDLGLTQYLNKVTVENAEGITTYEYKDTNFAKVEIHSKYMNGSKVTLEYKIVVKNNGTIPGYARKIVNYKPEGLEFNPELNKDWYVGDDGNIYSVKWIDKLLNPGETIGLAITLTKQMTNEDGGTIKNTVEIYEASNNEDVEDINSIPGDKLDGQNDMSVVETIVAVKTGSIILYITLVIVAIGIIGLGFYKINKLTLNKKGGC